MTSLRIIFQEHKTIACIRYTHLLYALQWSHLYTYILFKDAMSYVSEKSLVHNRYFIQNISLISWAPNGGNFESNHWQLNCFCNNMVRLTKKKIIETPHQQISLIKACNTEGIPMSWCYNWWLSVLSSTNGHLQWSLTVFCFLKCPPTCKELNSVRRLR